MGLSTSTGAVAAAGTTRSRRGALLAVLVVVLLATATIVARGAPSAAGATADMDPTCGQTDPNAKVVAFTYVLDTTLATAGPEGTDARCPTDSEGTYWTGFLDAGHPVSAFTYPMNQTFVAPFWVKLVYHAALGREPDVGGQAYWTGVLRPTGKVVTLYDELMGSQERFSAASSVSDYVTKTYRFFVGEDPDPGGLQFWTNYLTNGGKPTTLTYALSGRPEVTKALVGLAYGFTLGREVDTGAVPYWSAVYRFFQGNELLVMALLTNSHEYFQDCQDGALPGPVLSSGSRGAAALAGGLQALASS